MRRVTVKTVTCQNDGFRLKYGQTLTGHTSRTGEFAYRTLRLLVICLRDILPTTWAVRIHILILLTRLPERTLIGSEATEAFAIVVIIVYLSFVFAHNVMEHF